MARTHRNLTAWSGVVFAAFLLGGCTGEEPSPPPTPAPTTESASPTPTPKAVVVAPSRPAAMDDDGPAGAEAAAVYFFSLDGYMQSTGDTERWAAMSHPDCNYCASRLTQAQKIQDGELQWIDGNTSASIQHTYAQNTDTGVWSIDVYIHQEASSVLDSNGVVVKEIPSEEGQKRVMLVWQDDGWVVKGVGNPPEQQQ